MSQKHTPTPWIVYQNSSYYEITGNVEHDGNFQSIADTCPSSAAGPEYGRSLGLGRANAEFIVRACNAHDDLVAALNDAEILIVDLWYSAKGNPVTVSDVEAVRQRIALVQAKAVQS